MKLYFAADHAGFEMKESLLAFARDELGHDVEDCGAYELDAGDDYPPIIAVAARKLVDDAREGLESRAVLLGASGQGEAMVANRFPGVRAAVYYGAAAASQTDASGATLDMLSSSRAHNDANALSLSARFLSIDGAKDALKAWLPEPFSNDERHLRRIKEIEDEANSHA